MQLKSVFLKGLAALIVLTIMAGCTTSSRVIKTYEGPDQSADRVARLVTPGDIQLVAINGIAQKEYLIDNLSLTYELLPGEHVVSYRYSSIWARPQGQEDQDSANVDAVESPVREVRAVFQGGETYTLQFSRPETRAEALRLREQFSATLVDSRSQTVVTDSAALMARAEVEPATQPRAQSTPAQTSDSDAALASGQPAAVTAAATGAAVPTGTMPLSVDAAQGAGLQAVAPSETGLSRVEALKVLWSKASAEEKKLFLRWAFQ